MATPARAQGVTVAILPATLQVAPGAGFDLDLVVTQPGSAFNGFDAVVGFDPAALTLVPSSPTSLQQGTLMTGACGQTFHLFQLGATSASITDVLLCSSQSVNGPGQIYRLHFVASTTPRVTQVRFLPGLQFYNDGLFVNPAVPSDATIGIGTPPVGVGDATAGIGISLRVVPNPASGSVVFATDADHAGTRRLNVFDPTGRLVRRLEVSSDASGPLALRWDARDERGRTLPPGVYVVQLDAQGRSTTRRLALVR
jgi:hypothetical protein